MGPMIIPASPVDMSETARAQIAVAERLCAALRDFLCFESEQRLKLFAVLPTPGKPWVTPEMLVQAKVDRDRAEKKLELVRKLVMDNGPMSEMAEAMFVPDLEAQLEQAERYLAGIQEQLDAKG